MNIVFYKDLYNPAVYGQASEGQVKDIPDDVARQLIDNNLAGIWQPNTFASSVGLVSCIMPTKNRRSFIPAAIACFQAQTYDKKELLIVDNGDSVADLMPNDRRIRYMRLTATQTTGQLRNFCCQQARGEFIAHWDDDDWSHPRRLEEQIVELGEKQVTGYRGIVFHGPGDDVWMYSGVHGFAVGTSLLYRRKYWEQNRFVNQQIGEDGEFVRRARESLAVSDTIGRMVARTHDSNTSPRMTRNSEWSKADLSILPEGYR